MGENITIFLHHAAMLFEIKTTVFRNSFVFRGLIRPNSFNNMYLIDFAMDEQDYAFDESNMSQAYFYDINLGGAEKIAQVRATALGLKRHVCIPLNDSVRKRPKVFDFTDNVVGETTYFPEAGVVVSALKFVPQIGGLLVGFNFGGKFHSFEIFVYIGR